VVASRLAREKGVDVAATACARAGVELRVAGDGPERGRIAAAAPQARLLGRVSRGELRDLVGGAAVALAPSRAAETFGLAAAEAMAAGVPVVASRVGALPELVPEEDLVTPGDADALATALRRRWRDAGAGRTAIDRARASSSPERVAAALRDLYAAF
jgi:glycosyltransferase involved in cell wall biosynthesis